MDRRTVPFVTGTETGSSAVATAWSTRFRPAARTGPRDRSTTAMTACSICGKDAPGGPISPFIGQPVETILQAYFVAIPEAQAGPGDILVWKGPAPETTPHSAVLATTALALGK